MADTGFLAQALLSHHLFHTDDLDEARSRAGEVLSPHDLKVMRAGHSVSTDMYRASLGAVSFNRIRYSADVEVSRGGTESCYLVQFPVAGSCLAHCGNTVVHSTSRIAAVVTPTQPLRMLGLDGCEQVIVKIERDLLERYCSRLLGSRLPRPLEFEPEMQLISPQVASLLQLIEVSLREVDRQGTGMLDSPLARSNLEQMLVHALLHGQPNNYSDELRRPSPQIAPYYVKRAEEYIRAHADEPIGIMDIAEQAGVSISALYTGFKKFRSVSPMAFLRSVRLQRVRDELLSESGECVSITDVAMRQGFRHLGHFSAAYRSTFGESPSETLRQSRGGVFHGDLQF